MTNFTLLWGAEAQSVTNGTVIASTYYPDGEFKSVDDASSFLASNMTMQAGTNEFVAAICDEAGNMQERCQSRMALP